MTSEQRNKAADVDCSAIAARVRANREIKARWTVNGVKATRPRPTLCESCGNRETRLNEWGEPQLLSFDHCHETHKFRGWLCGHCNVALGFLRDDTDRILKLKAYLEANDQRQVVQ